MMSGVTEDDPNDDPEERNPVGLLCVPTRSGPAGSQTLRLLQTAVGVRTAVGFTSPGRLTAVMGPGQNWIEMALPGLRALVEPLGVAVVTVDPQLIARPPWGESGLPAEEFTTAAAHRHPRAGAAAQLEAGPESSVSPDPRATEPWTARTAREVRS